MAAYHVFADAPKAHALKAVLKGTAVTAGTKSEVAANAYA
jgi:hypothetical protein